MGPVNEQDTCSRCVTKRLFKDSTGELYCPVCGNRPVGPTMNKREFLRSQGIVKRFSKEEMAPVIAYAEKYGISAAARKFNHPVGTVGKWAKGKSPFIFGVKNYPPEQKESALRTLDRNNRNFYSTAKVTGIPRSTLQKWDKDRSIEPVIDLGELS